MKIVKNRVAQVAIEVLVIMGILVIGSIVLGMTYVSSHNKTIKTSDDVTKVQEESLEELKYKEGFNPAHPAVCGNGMCEADENDSSCAIDCHCGNDTCDDITYGETIGNCPHDCGEPVIPIDYNCTFVSKPTFNPIYGTINLTPESQITISHSNDVNCNNYRIYYTYKNNGTTPSDPTPASTQYSNSINVSTLVPSNDNSIVILKIKAIAYANSNDGNTVNISSAISEIDYNVIIPYCFFSDGTGNGTLEDPRIICNLKELNDVRKELNLNYLLGKNLDLRAEAFAADGIDYIPESGWEPIGSEGDPFTGSFDGNEHTLSNIFIPREDYAGFFGYIRDGSINNLYLIDSEIKANNYSGVLAGYSDNSTITNCSATGQIFGRENIGGLIGYSINSEISNSFSSVDVSANESIGGLIGATKESIISNCFSRGKVIGKNYFAGFIGVVEDGQIYNSYSTGLVKKEDGSSISDSGFIKKNNDGVISDCYWDIETSQQPESAGGGEGKPTDEMKIADTFINWDFDTIWKIDGDSINNGYPYLQNNLIIETT